MKKVAQIIIAIILMTLMMLGGAAPYGQDEPDAPTPTPVVQPCC